MAVVNNILLHISHFLKRESIGCIVDFRMEIQFSDLQQFHKFAQKKVMEIFANHLGVDKDYVHSYYSNYNNNINSVEFFGEVEFTKNDIIVNADEQFFKAIFDVNQVGGQANAALKQDILKRFNMDLSMVEGVRVEVQILSHENPETATVRVMH